MKKILSVLFGLAGCALLAHAQTITGAITGTITDATGGVVPSVTVTGTNTETNLKYQAQSNESGVYNLLFLPIGSYRITAEKPGFKTTSYGPLTIEVNQSARVDMSLQVGQVTESVEVSAAAPVLQTENAQTGSEISAKQATELPLNGRNFASLTLLVPGAITPNPNSFNSPARQFSGGRPYVNGNREQTNNFLLDGVDMNEPIDDLVAYNPNVDALGEMQVLTGNANAEFGNGNGAIVNMTIKSGTNQFHGNAFEFLQNDALNANSFFSNRAGVAKSTYWQNTYGGTFGGPIKKDKLFFFADYQGTKQRTSGLATATVAPQALRTGDLSVYTSPIIDPTTGKQFQGNMIQQSRIVNPVAKALFANTSYYPLPNNPGTGPQHYVSDWVGQSATALNNDQADAKIDYRLSDRDSLFGRFTIERYFNGTSVVVLPTSIPQPTEDPTTAGVINWTHSFTNSAVNEARVGFTRVGVINRTSDVAGVFGLTGNSKIGIPGTQPVSGISSITFGDFSIGSSATDSAEYDNDYHFSDNFSKQVGNHGLKMGFNFIRYQENRFYAGNNGLLGNFGYDGTYTGNGYADFLLDLLHTKGRGSQTGFWGHRQWRDGIFFQDDWKVRPNLTVNLGLRWEYTQPVYEVNNLEANVNLQTGQELFAGKNGNSRALYNPYYKQFMPRLGIAWTPGMFHSRLVVRTGYGITSYMEGTGANLRLPLNPPFFFESAVTYGLNAPGSILPGFTDVLPQSTLSGQVRAWNPDLRPAFIQQYNFSLEYQFTNSLSLTTAYVGQKGTHLVDPREYNQPLPGTGPVSTWAQIDTRRPLHGVAPLITNISGTDSSAVMNYNSLQVTARQRYSNGFQLLLAYTFSKTLTDNLGYYGSGGVAGPGAYWQNAYNRHGDYGRAFFDATHNISLSGFYDLPVGRNRHYGSNMNRAADFVVGGWKANFVASLHSGFPITMTGRDSSSQIVRGSLRANFYRPLVITNQNIDHWFGTGEVLCATPGVDDGTCAYGNAAPGAFGSAGPSTEQAPAFKNLDFGMGKEFHLTEQKYFDFRADMFNILNHPNFGPPNRSLTSPAFGTITGTIGIPRTIQFGMKFYF